MIYTRLRCRKEAINEAMKDDMQEDLRSLRPLATLDRRGFVTTALAGGFAAATLPVSAETIVTSVEGLDEGEARIPVPGGLMPAYYARPARGSKLPIVLVVQEIFGVHEHIRDVCRRFARLGAIAVAPELFARQGDPSKIADIQTLIRDIVSKVPDAQVMADLDATLDWARTRARGQEGKVGITGFCWGGRITWLYAAHSAGIAAGVAWYGRVVGQPSALQPFHPIDVAATLRAPVLGLYAGEDAGIPLEGVESMRAAFSREGASAASRGSDIVVYPAAGHGFYADYRASYRREDAQDAFRRAVAFLRARGLALQDG